jgi:threonine dehydrogenase-like Zn-dependent dehydrogenase
VYRGVERLEVADVPDPVIEAPGDAIVRVGLTAICGSDLHLYHGKAPLEPGDTIGHEAIGVIEQVGPAVTRFAPGQRVVVSFDIACGVCWFCLKGQTQLCEDFGFLGYGMFGGSLGGAQAELLRVPVADVNLLAVPEELADDRALFVGDALTTGVYAAGLAEIGEGDTVAVVGAGPVSFFCAQAALPTAASVLALDLDPARLALAGRTETTPIDVSARNATDRGVRAHGRARGGHRDRGCRDARGVRALARHRAARRHRRRDGRVYTSEIVQAQIGVWWIRALQLRFAGTTPVHTWRERAMADVEAGRLDPRPIVSHRLPLEEAPKGYELFDTKQATKVLLEP